MLNNKKINKNNFALILGEILISFFTGLSVADVGTIVPATKIDLWFPILFLGFMSGIFILGILSGKEMEKNASK